MALMFYYCSGKIVS